MNPVRALAYRLRWHFPPPPDWSDMCGYELLLDAIERHRIAEVEGDVVEIGAFMGGGTYKLCRFFERASPEKTVYAIDVFEPGFDLTESLVGQSMADQYRLLLDGRDQRMVYDQITGSCTNLVTIAADSATVSLPCAQVAYAHIDGNHRPEYVRGDFDLVWPRTTSGGIVSFDDYGHGFPPVTRTIHELIGEHAAEIDRFWTGGRRTIFVRRR